MATIAQLGKIWQAKLWLTKQVYRSILTKVSTKSSLKVCCVTATLTTGIITTAAASVATTFQRRTTFPHASASHPCHFILFKSEVGSIPAALAASVIATAGASIPAAFQRVFKVRKINSTF